MCSPGDCPLRLSLLISHPIPLLQDHCQSRLAIVNHLIIIIITVLLNGFEICVPGPIIT